MIEVEFRTELQTVLWGQLRVCPITIPRNKRGRDPSLGQGDDITKPDAVGPQGTFHHVHAGYRIWGVLAVCAPIASGLRDKVEAFRVDEEYIDIPYRVENQADLCEIEAWGNVSKCQTNVRRFAPPRLGPRGVPLERRTVS